MKSFLGIFCLLCFIFSSSYSTLLSKNRIKTKAKIRKHQIKFKQSEIIKEGWLKLCQSPQKSSLIPGASHFSLFIDSRLDFLKNPLYGVKSQNSIPSDEAFYFRFSGKNIFYTYSETDMKVLGAIAVKKVIPLQDFYLRKNCFEVSSEREKWMLCGCSPRKENWIEVISNPRTITLNFTTNESLKAPEPQNRSNLSSLPEPVSFLQYALFNFLL